MTRWRVYYGNGTTYTDRDGPPEAAPRLDVQVVANEIDGQRHLVHGGDYYCFRDGIWLGTDLGGMWDYLMHTEGTCVVLFGRSMHRDDNFWALVGRAGKEGVG